MNVCVPCRLRFCFCFLSEITATSSYSFLVYKELLKLAGPGIEIDIIS